jgi:hypothetical protein
MLGGRLSSSLPLTKKPAHSASQPEPTQDSLADRRWRARKGSTCEPGAKAQRAEEDELGLRTDEVGCGIRRDWTIVA